jgi:hypothetical protein
LANTAQGATFQYSVAISCKKLEKIYNRSKKKFIKTMIEVTVTCLRQHDGVGNFRKKIFRGKPEETK